MTYVLMNRPMVYKIMNEMAFPTDTAKKGFQHKWRFQPTPQRRDSNT
jgi:hypothetical protein